jgi:aryl-alcohol dehydrogenase-like predicted oxidoreductase
MASGCLHPQQLGHSGIQVSGLSLGSWRTYERLPASTGVEIMRAAHEAGITFFDDARYNDETGTAPMPTGYSEVVFGTLFRDARLRRDEVVVANKLWWEFWPDQSAAAELDASLGRMGFDYVDLIYAAPPPAGMTIEYLVTSVAGLVTAGKARAWGFLNTPADVLGQAHGAAAALGVPGPCAIQLPYSLVRRSVVEDAAMTQALAKTGACVVASFSLAGGVLTGKYLNTGPDARGRAGGSLGDPALSAAVAAAADLAELAARVGASSAALALAFPLANPVVASVLFGATSTAQVRANCAAAAVLERLGPGELAALRQIGAEAGAR